MTRKRNRSVVFVAGLMLCSGAIACSTCLKDILTLAEFDRRSWDYAGHVFVALITAAELMGATNEIQYKVRPEEIFKGDPNSVARISSHRLISEWNGLREIGCGDLIVSVGDRLVVFADDNGEARIGRCSATRVIEGAAAPSNEAVDETLRRLRQWSYD